MRVASQHRHGHCAVSPVSSHLRRVIHSCVLIPVSHWLHLHRITHSHLCPYTCIFLLIPLSSHLHPHTCVLAPASCCLQL